MYKVIYEYSVFDRTLNTPVWKEAWVAFESLQDAYWWKTDHEYQIDALSYKFPVKFGKCILTDENEDEIHLIKSVEFPGKLEEWKPSVLDII